MTGTPKMIPIQDIYKDQAVFITQKLNYVSFVHLVNLKRYAKFYLASPVKLLDANIPCGSFSMSQGKSPVHNLIPEECDMLYQEEASYYVHALFTLAERELHHIKGYSSDLFYSYMKFITKHQGSLCDDIQQGTVSKSFGIPENIHKSLSGKIKANPGRADHLRREFRKGVVGFAKRVWPDLQFVMMSKSASFKMCANLLEESYFKGVKTIAQEHASAEAICGVNLESQPGQGDYLTLMPYPCFSEFIPIEDVEEDSPRTLSPEEVVSDSSHS